MLKSSLLIYRVFPHIRYSKFRCVPHLSSSQTIHNVDTVAIHVHYSALENDAAYDGDSEYVASPVLVYEPWACDSI